MRRPVVLAAATAAAIVGWLVVSTASKIGIHEGYAPEQSIAFPHKVHAGDNQVPCLYCHYGARTSRHAGIPAVGICMNCHSLLEKQTIEIEKLVEAVQMNRPVAWVKVHNLPDFVYFNHSQHVLSGVDCRRCHGPVEQMDRVQQVSPLTMGWCIECHRDSVHLPTASVPRAAANLAAQRKPSPGLDCASCHY